MSFLSRKVGSKGGSIKAPSYDPYGRYKNTGNGIFGFRKDKHVIIPGVTSYEERQLAGVMKYVKEKTGKECTLSQDLINDVYSIYVNDDVKRRPHTNQNSIRHQVLDKVYDSLTKVVTVDSPLYTNILTRELALVLQKVDDEIRDKQQQQQGGDSDGDGDGDNEPQGLESSMGSGDADENGDKQEQNSDDSNKKASKESGLSNRESLQDIVDKALNNAENNIEKAKSDADQKIKDLENQLGKEAIKDLMNNNPEFLEEIDNLKNKLSRIAINKDSIKKILEKILNESLNYFSTKFKTVEESLFECEECEDLFGLEFLHPAFRNSQLFDVGNETRVYKGKLDLYLDCSGSMSSYETFEGTDIRMIDLAKGIAMILYRMGMIENLYFFDGQLYQINNINEISILSFSKCGGTDFNRVVQKIRENGNNSIIVTDGFDSCKEYSKLAFWIGIGGTTFQGYNDQFVNYRKSRQCVSYNSSTSKFDYCV